MSSRAKDFEPTRILHPWALLMGSWGYFTPPKKKIFTPPKKSKKFLLNKEAKPRQRGLGEIFQVKICLRRFVFEIFAKNKKSDLSAYKV
jgi:hypothetical protein